jgi:hypothetical protein
MNNVARRISTGPWQLDSAKDGDTRYHIIHAQLPPGINADFGYPVADTMNRHHNISPVEDLANALLIAAAPELLEALEMYSSETKHDRPLSAWILHRDAKTKAALRRVKGEPR